MKDKSRKKGVADKAVVELTVHLQGEPGNFKKKIESKGKCKHLISDSGDLNFSQLKTAVTIMFSLEAPKGTRFPTSGDYSIDIARVVGNGYSSPVKHVFPESSVSKDGLTLTVENKNLSRSGTWTYTLYVETNGEIDSIDPMIINRSD